MRQMGYHPRGCRLGGIHRRDGHVPYPDAFTRMIQSVTQLLGLPTGGLFGIARIAKGLATDYEPTTDREKMRRTTAMIHNAIHDRTYSRGQSDSQSDILRQTLIHKKLIKPSVTEGELRGRVWRQVKDAEHR